jgi:signal transduction histidine kinase
MTRDVRSDRPIAGARSGHGALSRYGVATLAALLCAGTWWLAAPHIEFEAVLLFFVLPVLVGSWFGGVGPGATATVLMLASAVWLMPIETTASAQRGDYLDLSLFATEAALIVVLTGALRRARDDAERANRAKDVFLASVSHELRTPLNVILGRAAQLHLHADDPAAVARALAAIERAARMQARLVEDLLDVSRAITGRLTIRHETVALASVLESAIDDARTNARAKAIELSADVHLDALIEGDPVRLHQVFSNLLVNAIKFTPQGGRVSVHAVRSNGHAAVDVVDSGVGIPADLLPGIFEPFQQVSAARDGQLGGMGLGLAIAKRFVELHGGRISAQSAGPGRGSRFTVVLPEADGR